jgi:hypothetical protein
MVLGTLPLLRLEVCCSNQQTGRLQLCRYLYNFIVDFGLLCKHFWKERSDDKCGCQLASPANLQISRFHWYQFGFL